MNIKSKFYFFQKPTGFTLIELIVVIIIISLLSVVAVPQYKRAIARSRYKMMLPVGRAIHTGQESFYVAHGYYDENLTGMDVTVPAAKLKDISVASHSDDTSSYLLLTHKKLNNTLAIYNKHSERYPNRIYCEAKNDDPVAAWVCESAMRGTKVESGSLTPGYTAYALNNNVGILEEPEEPKEPHVPVNYTNESGEDEDAPLMLEEGDSCTASQAEECQYLKSYGAECSAQKANEGCANSYYNDGSACSATGANEGCASSFYDDGSTCSTVNGGKHGCAFSEFSDKSTCTAGQEGGGGTNPVAGCQGSVFTNNSLCVVNQNTASNAVDTACGGNDKGGKADATGANSAQYYSSECVNASNSSFGCGRSWYKEGSTCTSNTKNGGCGNSLFDASRCIGRGGNGCDKSHFMNGSVCEARVSGTCPYDKNNVKYDETSYCTGKDNNTTYSYCPSGLPAEAGPDATRKKWRACTTEEKSAATAAGFSTSGLTCAD